jgi:hypothetical protein
VQRSARTLTCARCRRRFGWFTARPKARRRGGWPTGEQCPHSGDKALLRANAKTRGEIFRKAASPSDVAIARQRLNAEARGPQPIVPTDQLEDQNRWVAVAGGALEGLVVPVIDSAVFV